MFLTNWNLANYQIEVMDIATVDDPGVIYITANGVSWQHELYTYLSCVSRSAVW